MNTLILLLWWSVCAFIYIYIVWDELTSFCFHLICVLNVSASLHNWTVSLGTSVQCLEKLRCGYFDFSVGDSKIIHTDAKGVYAQAGIYWLHWQFQGAGCMTQGWVHIFVAVGQPNRVSRLLGHSEFRMSCVLLMGMDSHLWRLVLVYFVVYFSFSCLDGGLFIFEPIKWALYN